MFQSSRNIRRWGKGYRIIFKHGNNSEAIYNSYTNKKGHTTTRFGHLKSKKGGKTDMKQSQIENEYQDGISCKKFH